MIHCVIPNPAIDRNLFIERFEIGSVHRAYRTMEVAGGKGMNVARSLNNLGTTAICKAILGGHTGEYFAELAKQEGFRERWTWHLGATRICEIIHSRGADATVINTTGAEVDEETQTKFMIDVTSDLSAGDLVAICGSLPPGFKNHTFEKMITECQSRGAQVWLDTSGESLRQSLQISNLNIKVNASELFGALGITALELGQGKEVADFLRGYADRNMVITFGKSGAVCVSRGESWIVQTSAISSISTVGSGDAFFAGLLHSLAVGEGWGSCLHKAAATGAANSLSAGGGIFSEKDLAYCDQRTVTTRVF